MKTNRHEKLTFKSFDETDLPEFEEEEEEEEEDRLRRLSGLAPSPCLN